MRNVVATSKDGAKDMTCFGAMLHSLAEQVEGGTSTPYSIVRKRSSKSVEVRPVVLTTSTVEIMSCPPGEEKNESPARTTPKKESDAVEEASKKEPKPKKEKKEKKLKREKSSEDDKIDAEAPPSTPKPKKEKKEKKEKTPKAKKEKKRSRDEDDSEKRDAPKGSTDSRSPATPSRAKCPLCKLSIAAWPFCGNTGKPHAA